MEDKKPALLPSMLQMKCPNCRRGHMFVNKSIFPLGKLLDMPERCPVCGQKMELEVGFYYGTGYVSYALSVGLFFFNLIWYWGIIGLSYKDYSIFYYLITSVTIVVLLQPWLMRFSRVLYLYMFVKYGKGTAFRSEE
ncbi:DUF983 domain-containing protein [Polluticoccus soli]|uniref:DUF983 domain-containing protein n=1 Tax=Polluticoccus soli TaxID=3034150 RepID=UPI0023E30BC0|nr:DUF983 domain-containing protein [Flavipsychrobacter sp. JY13-12]